MTLKLFRGALSKIDIYGHPFKLNYKGHVSHHTYFGAFCSMLTLFLVLFNLIILVSQYRDKSAQSDSFQLLKGFSHSVPINLPELGMQLAIVQPEELPESLGRLKVMRIKVDFDVAETNDYFTYTEIPLVECADEVRQEILDQFFQEIDSERTRNRFSAFVTKCLSLPDEVFI